MRPAHSLFAALLLAMPLSCGKPKDKPITTAPGQGGGGGAGQTDGLAPLAPVTRAVELLSPRTLVVFDSAGPARIAEIIGREALVAKFPKQHAELIDDIVRGAGVDLLDPKALASIGVDVNGRMGVALLAAEPMRWALYWSIADGAKFRKYVVDRLRAQGQDVATVPMSGAELIRVDGPRVGLVLRGPLAILVGQDGEVKGDPALEIATTDPNVSLANDRAYRKATGGIAPVDWTLFANAGMLWELVRPATKEEPVTSNWARDQLEEAKARGDSKERIAELEAQAKSNDEFEKRWADRRRARQELAEWFIGGTGLTVWTASAKPGGIVAEGKLEVTADAPPTKLLRNHASAPALSKALATDPAFMLTGAIEPSSLVGFVDLALRTEGASWADAMKEAKTLLGVDLEADVLPLITGVGGVAMTLDGLPTGDRDADRRLPGVSIDLEVADATKTKALLDKVATQLEAERKRRKATDVVIRRDKKTGAWAMDFRAWRTLYVSVAGHHLVASTDPGLAGRIASGAEPEKSRKRPSALAAASLPGSSLSSLIDIGAFGLLTMTGFSEPAFAEAMVEDSETAKIPKSKAHKAKLRELEKAEAAARADRRTREAEQSKQMLAIFEPWGAVAGSVTEESTGLLARGGLFLTGNRGIAGALLDSLVAVEAMEASRERSFSSPADEQVFRLREEARQIRERDVEAWRAKHNKGAASVAVPTPEPAPAPQPR